IGLAFRGPDDLKQEVVDYLRSRELVTQVYLERMLPLRLADGRRVMALAYVIDRAHEQYAGGLDVETAVRRVSGATGVSGANEEYVTNTLDHLRGLGIRDAWLEAVGTALQKRP
ncbi:MAG: gamma-glutamylcyclotransferase, partial [Mesorhizobium sp.]